MDVVKRRLCQNKKETNIEKTGIKYWRVPNTPIKIYDTATAAAAADVAVERNLFYFHATVR